MPIPAALARNLALPVIGAPMFIVSTPALVIAQCRAGIVGAFPALNARAPETLAGWLAQIVAALGADAHAAPFAVNLIVHASNPRLDEDLAACAAQRVPLVITSLGAPREVVPRVHDWGGLVFHDVTGVRHAEKALEAGVDGLILVCAGAGGHAGTLSPFALVAEIRRFYAGPLALAGAIASGAGILAAQAMGADFAYLGTRFIAAAEANASPAYQQAVVAATARDIVYTPYFTGVHGNYLAHSIVAAGLDPARLPERPQTPLDLAAAVAGKAWRDIWGAGQGVGSIDAVEPVAALVGRLRDEYLAARLRLCAAPAAPSPTAPPRGDLPSGGDRGGPSFSREEI
jgi:nitronate monooxygenase